VRDLQRQMGVLLDQETRHALRFSSRMIPQNSLTTMGARRAPAIHQQTQRGNQRARHRQHLLLDTDSVPASARGSFRGGKRAPIWSSRDDLARIFALVGDLRAGFRGTLIWGNHQRFSGDHGDDVADSGLARAPNKFVPSSLIETLARLSAQAIGHPSE